MKQLFLKSMLLLSLALLPVQSYSQGLQRYTNSLFAEYGLLRYNNDGNEWLGENSNLLSLGLGYHRNISGFLALGFKAKHYEISGPAPYTYNSNTIQLQFRLQRPRISRTFRLRRFNPYLEAGFGHAAEYVNRDAGQSTAVYAYASLAAGADYNFSDHWSLGLQGEYRLSGKDAASVSDDPGQALNPFNTLSARLNFYFGRNRHRPAVPRIYTRPGTVAPADSMGRRRLDISPVSRELQAAAPDPLPAVPALPQAGTVAIRDTVLVRIVHADAGNKNAHPAGMPEPGPVLPRTDTLAVGDAAIRPQQNLIVSPDTMAGIKQVTTRTDSALTILKQEPVFKKDSNEVIAKIPAPVQGSDTAFPQQSDTGEKKDTLLSADTGILPQPDTATILPGSSPARVKQDTVWRTIRDTVSLYRRDTITVFARDTITQLKRDIVVEQANGLLQQQHTQELKSTSEETGDAGTAHHKEQDKQEPANAAQLRTGQDSSPQQTTAPDQQLQQRLKQLESDNAELQTRLQES
ncbi:MAG: porin family protein, partial [Chitinophagaceae bacterium]|nr:porin family protein [Chitinophagaceae bacterium]